MTKKTAAELQIEYLKNLKKSAPGSAEKRPRPAPDGAAKSRDQGGRAAVRVDRERWRALRERAKKAGTRGGSAGLLDWCLELALGLPASAAALNEEAKREFFSAARQWLAQRGIQDDEIQ